MKYIITLISILPFCLNGQTEDFFEGFYVQTYYKNGELKSQGNTIDNKKNGIWKFYYQSGEIKSEGNFKNDRLHGIWKLYYKNGELEEKKTWKNGVIDGAFQNYSKENQLIISGNYLEGRIVSKKCFTAERLEIPCE